MRTGRIVQLKKATNPSRAKKLKIVEGTIVQDNFGSDLSFTAPMELGEKLTLGVKVAFEPLPYRKGDRGVGE
ncbi:hypothetical protein KY335_00870, partial [Candidatus Woesearchaeota archaeon]|nr:hypothetical protein [Candidatus Woesearchaeota archaeon]